MLQTPTLPTDGLVQVWDSVRVVSGSVNFGCSRSDGLVAFVLLVAVANVLFAHKSNIREPCLSFGKTESRPMQEATCREIAADINVHEHIIIMLFPNNIYMCIFKCVHDMFKI